MIFTIAQTFFYALWQAFGYRMATLGLYRAGLLHRQRHLRAFLWLLAINLCGTLTFGAAAWQSASQPAAVFLICVGLLLFCTCHLWLLWKHMRQKPQDKNH
ncbi:MAG: hypothetical protein ACI4OK_09010 [Selenomonas bovis]